MKRMKGLTIFLLSCLLVITAAACGGKSSSGNGGGSSPAPSASEAPKVDLGGRTIRLAMWWDGKPKPDSDTGKAQLAQLKKVEDKYNVKIEYVNVPWDKMQEKFTTTVLAGQPFADALRYQYDWALTAAVKGQLQKLNDFVKIADSKKFKKGFPLKGEYYGFDGKGGLNDGGVYYNRDLFKKLGLTDPQELYDQGKWNWQEFENLAKLATQDTNSDGKPDTWGWCGWNAEAARFFVAANGGVISDDINGKETLSDPKTIEALEFESKLYNVDHVVKVKKGDVDLWEERNTFADGDVAMTYGWMWLTGEYKKKNVNYGYVPFPLGPKGTDFVNPVGGDGHEWFIPKGVENPQVVVQIMEELQDVPTKEAYPGQDYLEATFKSQKDIDLIRKMEGKYVFMIGDRAYKNYPFTAMVSDIIKNNTPGATAAEKVKQKAQASMDAVLKTP